MHGHFSWLPPTNRLARFVCLLLTVCAFLFLLQPADADLFYKVEKMVSLNSVASAPDQTQPMVVTGLSDGGLMVGFFTDHYDTGQRVKAGLHAFAWDHATQHYDDINDAIGAHSSMAVCVNASGTVAGVQWDVSGSQQGFVWKSGVTPITFQSPDGGDIDLVTGINSLGQVIGTYYSSGDMNKRAFLWDGFTCTDLGDFDDSLNPYIWPQAINDLTQVVGTSYGPSVGGLPLPTAFLWSHGVLGELDGADDFVNTQAVGINGAGAVIGKYRNPPYLSKPAVTGGFHWLDGVATDLSDLGGGGSVPFWIDATGKVYGTSFGSDALLHLFGWDTGTISDLGAARLSDTDLNYQMTSVNAYGEATGFIHDASNHVQGTLATGGHQYRVAGLLPAYLAYTQMSSAYGSQVLINDAGMIACAGTSATGQQMALLISIDPDTDNDGLPDSWEMQYYGQLGVGKSDSVAGGSGLTNWQAYQQGCDPNDFYNGQAPRLSVVSGDTQSAAPSSFLPAPLVVQLANNLGIPASSGAAVTFSVASGGGKLQVAREASPKTTVSVFTDANGQAKAFFRVSTVSGATSSINAVPKGTNPSNPAVFQETADDNSPVNPTPNDPNNPIIPAQPPVQSYACIDVSGSAVTANVERVALTDDGHVAFGFGTGSDPSGFTTGPSEYHMFTWQDGTLGAEKITQLVSSKPWIQNPSHTAWLVNAPSSLLSDGTICGVQTEMVDAPNFYTPADGYWLFSSSGGTPTIRAFPAQVVLISGTSFPLEKALKVYSVNADGTVAGWIGWTNFALSADVYYQGSMGFVLKPDGSYVIFPEDSFFTLASTQPALPNTITAQAGTLIPTQANKMGWCIGTVGGLASSKVGNGFVYEGNATLVDLGTDSPVGLNEQGQVIVQGSNAQHQGTEGYLWENGIKTILVDHLPAELQGQITDIRPYSISNQTTPGTDTTIYILARAVVNGTGATIVCTRDNDGVWSFAQIGLPSNVSYTNITTINSNGELAFTWHDNNDSIQASSTSTQAVRPAQTSGGLPQPAQTPSGNQKAGVGPKLDLKFNIAKPEAKDDDAWKRAKKAYDPNKPLQVGVGALFRNPKNNAVCCGIPYEYIYKLGSDNTGETTAKARSDMMIYELNSMHIQPMAGSVKVGDGHDEPIKDGTWTYKYAQADTSNSGGTVSFTTVTPPATPVMYAFDMPNIPVQEIYTSIDVGSDDHIDSNIITITLRSYPLFKQNSSTIDPSTNPGLKQVFWLSCKKGTPHVWSYSLDGEKWFPVQKYNGLNEQKSTSSSPFSHKKHETS